MQTENHVNQRFLKVLEVLEDPPTKAQINSEVELCSLSVNLNHVKWSLNKNIEMTFVQCVNWTETRSGQTV